MNMGKLQQLQKAMELISLQQGAPAAAPKTIEEAARKQYQFWDTQPVPKISEWSDSSADKFVLNASEFSFF